jgi:P4 family phage/plasmid primase-like protien
MKVSENKMTGINNANSDDDKQYDGSSNNNSDNESDNNSDNESDNNSDNESDNNSDNESDNNSDNESDNNSDNESDNNSDRKPIDNTNKKQIRSEFINFLNEHRYKKDSGMILTHTGMGKNIGSYSFESKEYKKFIKLYKQIVENGIEVNLVERSREVAPLLVDVDFNTKKNMRCYESSHIKEIIKRYNKVIKEYIKIDAESRYDAYVFEKDEPTKKDSDTETIYKDGFHIYYPYLPLSTELRYFIYHIATESINKDAKFLEDIPYINTINEIFDASVIKNNGMMMHGSNKPNRKPYELTRSYNYTLEKISIKKLSQSEIIDLSLLRIYKDDDSLKYKQLVNNTDVKIMIDEINNLYQGGNKKKDKKHINNELVDLNDNKNYDNNDNNNYDNYKKHKFDFSSLSEVNRERDQDQIELAKSLIKILNVKRADKYEDWRNLGWSLHKIDVNLLDEFIKFSKLCPKKYQHGCCEKLWMEAKDKSFCMPSLKKWAFEDNPKDYDKLLRKRKFEKIKIAISGTHVDIAGLIYEKYKDEYVFSDGTWYHFNVNKHRWEIMEEAIHLANMIKDDIKRDFYEYMSYYNKNAQKLQKVIIEQKRKNRLDDDSDDDDLVDTTVRIPTNDDDDNGVNEHAGKKLPKIVNMLGDINFIKKVIEACKLNFIVPKFQEKLDANPNLIGFDNGVIDLDPDFDQNVDRFRPGKPDDYISCSVNYSYKGSFKITSKEIVDITKYFEQVHSNENIRMYVLKFIASCLRGVNKEQKFNFWSGSGGNGKSTTLDLVRHTMGDYYNKLSVSYFTERRKSSNIATPELIKIMKARFVQVDEPDDGDIFYVGQMKEMTGNDIISVRALHKEAINIKPQFKFVLCCNNKPRIDATDGGTWRRVIDVLHGSIFTSTPDKTDKNQFKADDTLPEKLKQWNQAFMWLLVSVYYPLYVKEGNNPPAEVLQSTLEYQMESDLLLQFMTENVVKTQNDFEDVILVDELYQIFRSWFKESSFGGKIMDKKEFIKNLMNKKYKVEKNRYIKGIRFIIEEKKE